MVQDVPQLTERDGATRLLSNGEVLTYGRVRIEVCGKERRSAAVEPGHTPPPPPSIPAQDPRAKAGSKSKSKVKWYS